MLCLTMALQCVFKSARAVPTFCFSLSKQTDWAFILPHKVLDEFIKYSFMLVLVTKSTHHLSILPSTVLASAQWDDSAWVAL